MWIMEKFLEVRESIQSIINSSNAFVTANTNWKIPGIYLIYIQSPNHDKIIPFYIGQSQDIQRRYSKHLENLLAVNRIHPDIYKELFFEQTPSYYGGAFGTCKIHKYMVENKLSLSNFKMVILETCEPALLAQRETYFIDKFYASYFGFNQLNSLIYGNNFFRDLNPQPEMLDHLIDLLNQEIRLIPKYLDYGYTHFNLNYSFRPSLPESFGNKLMRINSVHEINKTLNDFNKQYKDIWKNVEYQRLMAEYEPYVQDNDNLQSKYRINLKILSEEIASFMESSKIAVRLNLYSCFSTLALGGVINELPIALQKTWKKQYQDEFNDYRKLVDINEVIQPMRSKILELKLSYSKNLYSEITPRVEYPPFALKDNVKMFDDSKPITMKRGEVVINMIISSNGRRFNGQQNPYLVKMELFYYEGVDALKQKQWYVKNECTINTKEGLIYSEEGHIKANPQIKPFSPYAFTKDMKDYESFISLRTEAKTGINDYTIQSNTLVPFKEILSEIAPLIDAETTIFIKTSEGPTPYARALLNENEGLEDNDLFQLLLRKKPSHQQIIIKPKKNSKSTPKSKPKKVLTEEQILESKIKRQKESYRKYIEKVSRITDNGIKVISFTGSKEATTFHCLKCGVEWSQRSDHFLNRPYCRNCNNNKS